MLFELFIALLIGVAIGTITGIAPGIHINLVSAIMLGISGFLLLHLSPLTLVVFLVSMSTVHTFVDFIPSIFLGAPDEDDTALSILPGHEMTLNGESFKAVMLTAYGGIIGIIIILLFTPLFIIFLPKLFPYAQRIMPFILITASVFLIYFEKSSRVWACLIFLMSGILGLATLSLPSLKEPLLPLFTGLFGVSSLLISITKKQKIPKQEIPKLKEIKISKNSLIKTITSSLIASPLCSFLPGLGSGQAAVIGSEVTGELDRKEFLILLGSISTIVTGLSFITLYSIGKSRTGIAAAVSRLINLNLSQVCIILLTIIIAGIFSFFITLFLAKIFSKGISKINYTFLSSAIILILLAINLIFSGFLGLLILLISTFVGLTCIYAHVKRTHLMGCLIFPTIVLYLL